MAMGCVNVCALLEGSKKTSNPSVPQQHKTGLILTASETSGNQLSKYVFLSCDLLARNPHGMVVTVRRILESTHILAYRSQRLTCKHVNEQTPNNWARECMCARACVHVCTCMCMLHVCVYEPFCIAESLSVHTTT